MPLMFVPAFVCIYVHTDTMWNMKMYLFWYSWGDNEGHFAACGYEIHINCVTSLETAVFVETNRSFWCIPLGLRFQAQAAFQTFKDLTAAVKAASSNGADALWPRFAIKAERTERAKQEEESRSGYIHWMDSKKDTPKKMKSFYFFPETC